MTTTPGTSLVVLKFPVAEGAQVMLGRLEALQKQQLITLVDGAIVTWPAGASKPKTEQLRSMTGIGALGGAFWGMLFGLLFFVPFFGLAVGAPTSPKSRKLPSKKPSVKTKPENVDQFSKRRARKYLALLFTWPSPVHLSIGQFHP